jgi:hypothetical protein
MAADYKEIERSVHTVNNFTHKADIRLYKISTSVCFTGPVRDLVANGDWNPVQKVV